ncbi:MAG: helix-turn-helix domain-containing protein [Planctomycetaceae bacterium]|nr:helix-turn-helix domain-containing protein [Planctomycetaceae bacterium]
MRHAKTPKELGFTHYDRRRLAKALKRASGARVSRRLQAVLLVARGRAVGEVAEITGVSPRNVYLRVRRYLQAHRPEDLHDQPRGGRPRAAEVITDECIRRELAKDPGSSGDGAMDWTVAMPADSLRRTYHCEITERTLRRRMRAPGLRWKGPRYVSSEEEPHRARDKGQLSVARGGLRPTP